MKENEKMIVVNLINQKLSEKTYFLCSPHFFFKLSDLANNQKLIKDILWSVVDVVV
jgi:hypothetical protein